MKDFDSWYRDLATEVAEATKKAPEHDMQMLPDGVWDDDQGAYFAECRGCGRECNISEFIEEIMESPNEPYRHYCGGSPHCLP